MSHAELAIHLRSIEGYEGLDEGVKSIVLCAFRVNIPEVLLAGLHLYLLTLDAGELVYDPI